MFGRPEAEWTESLPAKHPPGHKKYYDNSRRLMTILYYDPTVEKPRYVEVNGRKIRRYKGSSNPGVWPEFWGRANDQLREAWIEEYRAEKKGIFAERELFIGGKPTVIKASEAVDLPPLEFDEVERTLSDPFGFDGVGFAPVSYTHLTLPTKA